MNDIGELIVGAYLQVIEECDFVHYNTRLPGGGVPGLRELDVIGLKLESSTAYLCEVTTHLRGVNQGVGGNPRTVEKIKDKHAWQQEYARQCLKGFEHRYMYWSPYVPVGYITKQLEPVDSLELIINKEYTDRIERLRKAAKVQMRNTGNDAFRMLQILEHLRR